MAVAIKVSDELVNDAKPYAAAEHRSVTKQSNIGRVLVRRLVITQTCRLLW
jgi:hypothetical protein